MNDTYFEKLRAISGSMRVLLLEDEKIIALDLKKRLEDKGFSKIDIISELNAYIPLINRSMYDVLLFDDTMWGDEHKYDLVRRTKEKRNIPIIVLGTYYSMDYWIRSNGKYEIDLYIGKPFKESDLFFNITLLINKYYNGIA